jgi:hypothetical protein
VLWAVWVSDDVPIALADGRCAVIRAFLWAVELELSDDVPIASADGRVSVTLLRFGITPHGDHDLFRRSRTCRLGERLAIARVELLEGWRRLVVGV